MSGRDPRPFPWDEVLAFAFGVLRWSPAQVWRATPRELHAAARGLGLQGGEPASLADLDALLRAFPDHPTRQEDCATPWQT